MEEHLGSESKSGLDRLREQNTQVLCSDVYFCQNRFIPEVSGNRQASIHNNGGELFALRSG